MINNQILANQTQARSKSFIYILYGGMILYILYKIFTSYKERQNIKGQTVSKFRKEVGKATYILAALIVGFGVFNIVNKEVISGILMIALVLVLLIYTRDSIIVTEAGIYAQGKFLLWQQVKKWAFDLNSSELVLTYKEDMLEKNQFIKVDKDKIEELNMIIRKLKLGK